MSKRRMVGWQPLAVENTAPAQLRADTQTPSPVESTASDQVSAKPTPAPAAQPEASAQAPGSSGLVQDPDLPRRRMAGWKPLTVAHTAAPVTASADPVAQVPHSTPAASVAEQPVARPDTGQAARAGIAHTVAPVQAGQPAGPLQDPELPRRRMAGWTPLSVSHDAAQVGPVTPSEPVAAAGVAEPDSAVTAEPDSAVSAAPVPAAEADVTQDAVQASSGRLQDPDLPRRRMVGWQPLVVDHPDRVAAAVTERPAPIAEAPAPAAGSVEPAKTRMGAPGVESAPASEPEVSKPEVSEPKVKMPDVVTPPPAAKPAATTTVEKDVVKQPSKVAKVLLVLLGVAVVAAGLVLVAQWLRTLDPVAEFIATYDGTPTHPEGVVAGIPGWVGWQHFLNFFIMAMVIRSGLLIRNQQRPEAYWTPSEGGFYSPGKKNTPQKVSIQQWIHQSFNVLWVANGLFFYIMVFATGHWMRLVPTNWDIFPNIISAGLQYVSLDWPEENSWVYYNALQIMTYFLTVFVAAPLAVLTGLRLSTWWPQQAGINTVFSLPVARKIHFGTMVYFILFILVHLFLVFTTGVLSNLNMMFTARDASDWWGIGVFAVSVALTVGIAWLIKPIFVSPIAEKTGTVSTR